MGRSLLYFAAVIGALILGSPASIAQTAGFTSQTRNGCYPLLDSFTDNSTGTITSWYWDLGNSTTSTLQNPSTTYSSPGVYIVTLTVTGPGGSDSKLDTVTVYDKPAVSFSALPLAGCPGQAVQFSSAVVPHSPGNPVYSWDFGDGTSSPGATPNHVYSTPGTFTVSLTVTNGAGCSNTVSLAALIHISSPPVTGIVANPVWFCSTPGVVSFSNASTGGGGFYSTSWSFGDGNTGSGTSTSHTYSTSGSFTVKMVVTDANGCRDSSIIPGLVSLNTTPATFSAPAAICLGMAANFGNTTLNGGNTAWDFGDGTTGTGSLMTHQYIDTGTYRVIMTTTIGTPPNGCNRADTQYLTVHPRPSLSILQTPAIPCPAPVTVSWTAGSVPAAASYSWHWQNSSSTASGQTVSKTYTRNEQDRIVLIATTADGCSDSTAIDTVKIHDLITTIYPAGTIIAGCFPLQVSVYTLLSYMLPPPQPPARAPQPYPGYAVSYQWDFGDNSGSTAANPVHTYSVAGTWNARCIITTNNGCRDTAFQLFHADTPVAPSFTVSPLTACPRTPVTFINTTQNILDSTHFIWQPGDSVIVSKDTSRLFHGYRYSGTFVPRLYSDHNGCIDSFISPDLIVIKPPAPGILDSIYCSPSTTVKVDSRSYQATSELWDFGDGTTGTASSIIHSYPAPGKYVITQVVYSNVTGCTDTAWQEVEIKRTFMSVSASKTALCNGDSLLFSAIGTGYDPVRFSWQFDNYQTPYFPDTTVPGGVNFQRYGFHSNGYHNVALYLTSGAHCFDTLLRPAMILVSKPQLRFTASPPIGCNPVTVFFSDSSTNSVPDVLRNWNFGDGATLATATATTSHLYAVTGDYRIRLSVTDSLGCSDSLAIANMVSVNKPAAGFYAQKDSVCTGAIAVFVPTARGRLPLKFQWSLGDGSTDTGSQVYHRYLSAGSYTVRLIVTDSVGCRDTAVSATPIFVSGPVAQYTVSDSIAICPPQVIQFSNGSSGASHYLWDLGTGGSSTVTSPLTTYVSPGFYNTSLVAVNTYGCTDTARLRITVLGNNGAFTYTPINACVPMTVQFTPITSGIPLSTWDFSDGVTMASNGTPVTHTYTSPGAYLPKVIYSDGHACSNLSQGLDTIRADKLTADFEWTTPCAGVACTLSEKVKARFTASDYWHWQFAADSATGSGISHIFPAAGLYTVSLSAQNATGCRDSVTKQVLVNPLPRLEISPDTSICAADTARLYVSGAGAYVWSPSPLLPCLSCDTVFVHLAGSTKFLVSGTDSNGCVGNDSVTVSIQVTTTDSTGPGGEICIGDSFQLSASGAQEYVWTPAVSLSDSHIPNPVATPSKTTVYTVATREGSCLVHYTDVTVAVHSLPVFSAGNDYTIGRGSAVTLHPTQTGISRIEWKTDTTLSCLDCFLPVAHPRYTRTYYATGYNEFGCATTDSVTVFVVCNGDLVFVPNTFSPNGDGNNDYFFPRGDGIDVMSSFRVFNRWGEAVFERSNVPLNDEHSGWDGTFKGKALPPDVYVYTMQSRCEDGKVVMWKGDITLLH